MKKEMFFKQDKSKLNFELFSFVNEGMFEVLNPTEHETYLSLYFKEIQELGELIRDSKRKVDEILYLEFLFFLQGEISKAIYFKNFDEYLFDKFKRKLERLKETLS